jgi:stearoyl-CoA desaturase (delta-9 desaturase)
MTTSTTRAKAPGTGLNGPADPPTPADPAATRPVTRPDLAEESATVAQRVLVGVFVVVPLLALIAAIPLAWGWGLGWHDVVIALVFYWLTGLGITVGFHRYFTHGSFKAKTGLRVALAVFGTMAIEGPVFNWVADHRRHHKFSDREGDPHSPWRYGEDTKALAKGLAYAHMLWLFDENMTSQEKFIPDLLADRKLRIVHKLFPVIVLTSMLTPALIGGLWGLSWHGALTAFFWASLVRVALLHHVTWSINSICHTTCITPTRPVPGTVCSRASSTRAPG